MTLKIDENTKTAIAKYIEMQSGEYKAASEIYTKAKAADESGKRRAIDLEDQADEVDEQREIEIERQAERLANGEMPSANIPDSSQLRTDLKIQLKANEILKSKRSETLESFRIVADKLKRQKRMVAMAFLKDNGFPYDASHKKPFKAVADLTLGEIAQLAAARSLAQDDNVSWFEWLERFVSQRDEGLHTQSVEAVQNAWGL